MTAHTSLRARLAAAYVRGKLAHTATAAAHPLLFARPLDLLNADEQAQLVALGQAAELRLHRFKRTAALARVQAVLGLLHGLAPATLLDIGSGRGAFLWPLLEAFPALPVTALDMLDYRATDIQALVDGGIATLRSVHGNVTALPFADAQFDVVTLLEVLEHVPDTAGALGQVCRVAGRFVVLSVPSRPDTNPEHIHLFSAATLEPLLRTAGARRVTFTYVPGHIIAVAKVSQ